MRDNVFTTSEYEHINEEYTRILDSKMKKLKVVSVRILIVYIVFFISALFIRGISSSLREFIAPIIGSICLTGLIIFMGLIVFVLVSYQYKSSKPFYDYVMKKIVEKINNNLEINIQLVDIVKTKYDFNFKGGLFTRYCTTKVRMHLQGDSINGKHFDMYETILSTSNGKSQSIHLNGIYIVTPSNETFYQQIRSNGSPHLTGKKYKLIEKIDGYKNYLNDESMIGANYKYVNLFKNLHKTLRYKKAYMSIIEKEIHFAVQPVTLYKYKELSSKIRLAQPI